MESDAGVTSILTLMTTGSRSSTIGQLIGYNDSNIPIIALPIPNNV